MRVISSVGDYSEYTPSEIKSRLQVMVELQRVRIAFMVKRIWDIKGEVKPFDIDR